LFEILFAFDPLHERPAGVSGAGRAWIEIADLAFPFRLEKIVE
jgi:hypothetical protein